MVTGRHRIAVIRVCVESNLRIFVQVKQTYWLYEKKNNCPKRIRFVSMHCVGGRRTVFHRNPRISFPILHGFHDEVRAYTRSYFILNFIISYFFRGCAWVFLLSFRKKRHLKNVPTDRCWEYFLPIWLIVHASARRCVTFSDLWPSPFQIWIISITWPSNRSYICFSFERDSSQDSKSHPLKTIGFEICKRSHGQLSKYVWEPNPNRFWE